MRHVILQHVSGKILKCTLKFALQGTPEGVEDSGWLTRVAAFPIGIQPERFVEALEQPEVKGSIAGLLTRYAGRKVLPLLHEAGFRVYG